MMRCAHCHVDVLTPRQRCPLCESPLEEAQGPARNQQGEAYPDIPTVYKRHSFFFKLLIFLSVIAALCCVTLNIFFHQGGWWSLIVLLGIGYMWVTVLLGIQRMRRIGRVILYQLLAISALVIGIDLLYGNYGWALDFVVPALCVSAMLAMAIVVAVRKMRLEDAGIYLLDNALLGIVPLIFVLTGLCEVRWPSLSCVMLSFVCIVGLFIFGGRDMAQEFRRRFHI